MSRSYGRRPWIREVTRCASCGAGYGERCVSYRDTWHGPATGEPVTEIHAARWRAFRAWLAEAGRL